MQDDCIKIQWAETICSIGYEGDNWIEAAEKAGFHIPTGCLGGSCGACEIEVNGEVIRACISKIGKGKKLKVSLLTDPYW